MTDKLRAVAKMALQALECSYNPSADAQNEAITALRQALDQLPDTTEMIEPIGEIVEAHGLIAVSIPEMPPVGTKLYTAPPKPDLLNQICCECGRSGGYALYCGECWSKANEWQSLTDDEWYKIWDDANTDMNYQNGREDAQRMIEAKLKEKNT